MGDWPEAEHCQGSPELNRLHSTMGEQPGLICLWSLSGNPSQGKGDKTWETQMAFCSCQWVSMAHMCPAGGSLAPLLPCSPAQSFLVPGLYLSPQTSELHSAELLRRCFGSLIQTRTTSSSAWQFYVDE